jgi:hypothetical protein
MLNNVSLEESYEQRKERQHWNVDEANYLIHTSAWSVVDYDERDGYAYVTMRKPLPKSDVVSPALSDEEVMGMAQDEHERKLDMYCENDGIGEWEK